MEYVTNGYAVEKYSIDFTKRLSTKNARIYQKPVTRLATLQSDLAYVANEIPDKPRWISSAPGVAELVNGYLARAW